ncbi:MAG TPA: hypothetical protein VJT71_15075 [Pyrinomonadaceae bacterium]|nr:hypothetical protein [Pyrinomonadaceae bacterium]
MRVKRDIVADVDRIMGQFFATATDDEFWAELEEAGWAEFSEIDVPIIDYHRSAARYRVTAMRMSVPESAVTFAPTLASAVEVCTVGPVYGPFCAIGTVQAANSNELALAA